jgi:hypothetical protein
MANTEGTWLSINEYSQVKKVSISTIRRHIKANFVKWKDQDGKYYIWTPMDEKAIDLRKDGELLSLRLELKLLRDENKRLKEELFESKMLIQLYEQGQMLTQEISQ